MDIVGTHLPSPTLTLTQAFASSLWRTGQRLDAVVMALVAQDRVSIQTGDLVLEARTSLAITVGQRLHLEVIRADNQIVLRIITPPAEANPLAAAYRASLPHQLPLQTIFARFTEALSLPSGIPPSAISLLKQLLQQLPAQQSITRIDVLKQALKDSGLFLEHKLNPSSQTSSLDKDLKANLLRLLEELTHHSGDAASALTRDTEAALARIQLHQLSALAGEQNASMSWTGELPVRNGDVVDVFQFRIEKDTDNATAAECHSWSTWLSFNLKTLGPLYAKITLTNKNISATLWAELNATVDLINQHLTVLHQSLNQAKLEVKTLQCLQGHPPHPRMEYAPTGLLDLIA
jgi:hypothetical protein